MINKQDLDALVLTTQLLAAAKAGYDHATAYGMPDVTVSVWRDRQAHAISANDIVTKEVYGKLETERSNETPLPPAPKNDEWNDLTDPDWMATQ